MKKVFFFFPAIICIMSVQPAFSQKYKTSADTIKLNEEHVEVCNDIADLTAKLTIAKNNMPGYQSKAVDAASDAQNTARESSKQASKATNGELKDAKKAKKKANKALNDAEDAKDANDKVDDQDKKIASLNSKLEKKQKRLQELNDMRTAIRNMHL